MEAVDGENEVDMEFSSSQEALRRASEICGVPPALLRVYEMTEIGAYRVYQPTRGGVRVIIGRDGSLMFAASALSTDQATEPYKAGRRTTVQEFDDLRELNRKRCADAENRDG